MSGPMRRVLVLGAGLTSAPMVEYLTRGGDISLTVATRTVSKANQLAKTYQNITPRRLDVNYEEELNSLIHEHELVVSVIPFQFQPMVARYCLANNVNMVTSDYLSPEMQGLHQSAVDKGLTILNEIGVDPGIDHMLAKRCIDEVHDRGGQITSFESWCTGLPQPQYCNNPLNYKFSWYPAGAFLAAKRYAQYVKDNKVVELGGGKIMESENLVHFGVDESPISGVELEGYYNKDSTAYLSLYDIPEAHTIIRGTYRHKGFCKIVRCLLRLGLLEAGDHPRLQPEAPALKWRDLVSLLAKKSGYMSVLDGVEGDTEVVKALEKLGLLSEDHVKLYGSPVKTFCAYMEKMLGYRDGEGDSIYMRNIFGIKWPDDREEVRCIDLTVHGTIGSESGSAMARTVGLPIAMSARLLLSGELKKTGVIIPALMEIYDPLLASLEKEGIVAKTSKIR